MLSPPAYLIEFHSTNEGRTNSLYACVEWQWQWHHQCQLSIHNKKKKKKKICVFMFKFYDLHIMHGDIDVGIKEHEIDGNEKNIS